MDDWDASDDETTTKFTTPAVVSARPPVKKANDKWGSEGGGPVSDWENSESEEEKHPAPVSNIAPPKKKGTLKANLAEREAARAAKPANDDLYDEDAVLDPRARALRDKQRELESDMKNAADLFGIGSPSAPRPGTNPSGASRFGTGSSGAQANITSILNANPKTRGEFVALSRQIFELVIKRHRDKPLYATFVEAHVKELANPLGDVDVRKVANGLTALANEKQKELEKVIGTQKKASKPALARPKSKKAPEIDVYDEALHYYSDDADALGFM